MLNAVKYLIIGLTAKERPVAMVTVKAIGFLFSRIMNFSPLCVTLPLHSQPLRLNSSPRVLEIPSSLPYNFLNKRKTQKCSRLNKCVTSARGVGVFPVHTVHTVFTSTSEVDMCAMVMTVEGFKIIFLKFVAWSNIYVYIYT